MLPPAKTGAWFGRSSDAAVAFNVVRSRIELRNFAITKPDGDFNNDGLCPSYSLGAVLNLAAQVRDGQIVNPGFHKHGGLAGRVSGSHAHGVFKPNGGCELHWSADHVKRRLSVRDGHWSGITSNGATLAFSVAGHGEWIAPPIGQSGAMFAGQFGSCSNLNFSGALIQPKASFKMAYAFTQGGQMIAATASGSFEGSQSASGAAQGLDLCATPSLTWTAHR